MLPLSVVQLEVEKGEPEKNLKRAFKLAENLPGGGLIVLPEMFCCGFDYENLSPLAERSDEILEFLKGLSFEKGAVVVATLPLKREGKIYNAAAVVDRGKLLGFRAKVELFPLFEEGKHFAPAPEEENRVFETSIGKLGVAICFELRFYRIFKKLRDGGAQVVAVPAMWGLERREHFKLFTRTRAVEFQIFVAAANATGKSGSAAFAGYSGIYGPWGEELALAGEGEGAVFALADPSSIQRVRKKLPLNL